MLSSVAVLMSLPNKPPQTGKFLFLEEKFKAWAALEAEEMTGACRIMFLGQKGKFFVQLENSNTYFRLTKVKMNTHDRKLSRLYSHGSVQSSLFPGKGRGWAK